MFIARLSPLSVVKGKLPKLDQFTIHQEKSFVSSQPSQFSFRPVRQWDGGGALIYSWAEYKKYGESR